MTFLEQYEKRADAADSLLCVSLDPDLTRLPPAFQKEAFPQFAFNKHIIEATHYYVGAYILQMAFYEARGDAGFRELKMTIDYLRASHPDIPIISDAKRADMENTTEQYAAALFDWFGFDAVTLNPYFGKDVLMPFLRRKDKGCFILCRTTNPGAGEFQDLSVGGKSLWQIVAEHVRDKWNENGNCMIVAGATYPEELKKLRGMMGEMTFLVPGIGPQGGDLEKAIKNGVNAAGKGIIVVVARGVVYADDPGKAAKEFRDAINRYRGA